MIQSLLNGRTDKFGGIDPVHQIRNFESENLKGRLLEADGQIFGLRVASFQLVALASRTTRRQSRTLGIF